uniref:hypothetical protein n=1 Tax=Mycolicibacterium sp. CBMA 213 TaxID=1968788 RepID=UPI00155DB20C|nr:hypothetical protein [Mycolicibacterium sp. CBMA 213]
MVYTQLWMIVSMASFAFIQQGGASDEFYLHVHETVASADEHRRRCHAATYRTTSAVAVPDRTDFDVLQTAVETSLGADDWAGARRLLRDAAAR